jgi:hypothetical protein
MASPSRTGPRIENRHPKSPIFSMMTCSAATSTPPSRFVISTGAFTKKRGSLRRSAEPARSDLSAKSNVYVPRWAGCLGSDRPILGRAAFSCRPARWTHHRISRCLRKGLRKSSRKQPSPWICFPSVSGTGKGWCDRSPAIGRRGHDSPDRIRGRGECVGGELRSAG